MRRSRHSSSPAPRTKPSMKDSAVSPRPAGKVSAPRREALALPPAAAPAGPASDDIADDLKEAYCRATRCQLHLPRQGRPSARWHLLEPECRRDRCLRRPQPVGEEHLFTVARRSWRGAGPQCPGRGGAAKGRGPMRRTEGGSAKSLGHASRGRPAALQPRQPQGNHSVWRLLYGPQRAGGLRVPRKIWADALRPGLIRATQSQGRTTSVPSRAGAAPPLHHPPPLHVSSHRAAAFGDCVPTLRPTNLGGTL